MKRVINLIADGARISIPNTDSVDISKINDIVNYSVDSIFCYIFEYLKPDDFLAVFNTSLKKLRPDGGLMIRFTNFKKLCDLYQKDEISNKDLLNFIENKKNILSIDQIISLLDNQFVLNRLDYIDNYILMIIQRKTT